MKVKFLFYLSQPNNELKLVRDKELNNGADIYKALGILSQMNRQ